MTLGERLKLVRGMTSQKAFAAELGIHENSVSNAERRNSATQDYLLRIAEVRNINLHWLLTGRGAMRMDETDASLLQEKINVALVDALRAAYGAALFQRVARYARTGVPGRGQLPSRHRRERRNLARHRVPREIAAAHH